MGTVFILRFGDGAALGDIEIGNHRHGPGDSADGGVRRRPGLVDDFARGGAVSADGYAGLALGENCLVVVEGDVFSLLELEIFFDRVPDYGHLANGDDAGPVGVQLLGDEALGAIGQRDDGDDGRDADDYAQKREYRAELVGPEGLEGEFEGFGKQHWIPANSLQLTAHC